MDRQGHCRAAADCCRFVAVDDVNRLAGGRLAAAEAHQLHRSLWSRQRNNRIGIIQAVAVRKTLSLRADDESLSSGIAGNDHGVIAHISRFDAAGEDPKASR